MSTRSEYRSSGLFSLFAGEARTNSIPSGNRGLIAAPKPTPADPLQRNGGGQQRVANRAGLSRNVPVSAAALSRA